MKFLRKADVALIIMLALVPCAMLIYNVKTAAKTGAYLSVIVDGEETGRYSLEEDQVIRIGETNVCEISGGRVRMIHADCPDQICVYSADIGAEGGSIVCLPNKVILTIKNADSTIETELDAVVS